MAITMIEATLDTDVIDLRGHRLGELVALLSGCDVVEAELAVAEVPTGEAVTPDDALDALAAALVQIRTQDGTAA